MKTIELTQGRVALVDDEDFKWLSKWKWYAYNNHGYTWYAARTVKPHIYMHRVILNPPSGYECDHIDRDGLNNQRCNIRICTSSQNHMNRHISGGRSIYKGICWHKQHKKWRAYICFNRKCTHLGYYDIETEAAKAYDDAAIKYFGEFARLNDTNAVLL